MIYRIHNPATGHGFDPVETEDPGQWIIDRATAGGFDADGYVWEESTFVEDVPIISISSETRLANDMAFGQSVILQFLLDNRNDPNVRTSDSLALLQKFGPAKELLSLGDIKKCRALIDSFGTDLIFTLDRKTNYLSMIDTYLAQ